ncbi:MAG: succinate dehydrogenase, cytochrome b556 subunit [Acidimicrobiales bacterium]
MTAPVQAKETRAPGPYAQSTVYRGRAGQWAFILHRITGLLVFMFLLLHIVDVSMINFHHGRTYDEIHQLYGNILLRLFEVGLLFGLVFHALNGLRIVMVDFFPGAVKNQKNLFAVVLSLTGLFTAIGGVIIVKPWVTG